MTKKETIDRAKTRASASAKRIKLFFDFLTICPHVIPADIGAEAFVAEIAKGSKALAAVLKEDIGQEAPK
jgi:hypothetical protein